MGDGAKPHILKMLSCLILEIWIELDPGVKSANDLSVRAIGDVLVEGEVSVSVNGIGNVAVIMYLDSNGNWVVTTARVVNGRVIFSLPYPTTVVILSV